MTEQSWALAAVRRLGLLRRLPTGAVHTLVVQMPAGQQRTFRWAPALEPPATELVGWVSLASRGHGRCDGRRPGPRTHWSGSQHPRVSEHHS